MLPELTVAIVVSERCDELEQNFAAYDAVLRNCASELSYVIVVDGGFDAAGEVAERLARSDETVRVVRLNRPFGGSTALSIALESARTEWVLTLPPYLQVEPAALPRMFEATDDHDLITARRWPIEGYALNRAANAMFNWAVRAMTGQPFNDLGCGVHLLRRIVTDEIPLYGAQHRFLPITASQRGFRVCEVDLPQAEADQRLKVHGPGTYARRLIDRGVLENATMGQIARQMSPAP